MWQGQVAYEMIVECVTEMFLAHFDIFWDLLLNKCTASWNLFVLYNKETNHYRLPTLGNMKMAI